MGQHEEESHAPTCVVNWTPSWEYSPSIVELSRGVAHGREALAGNV